MKTIQNKNYELKTEKFYSDLAIKNIPNGNIYYDILTEYIRIKYKCPILSDEFMNDIHNKIIQITNDIFLNKIFAFNKSKIITCGDYFWINEEKTELHIEIRISDNNDSIFDCKPSQYTFLIIPIGLNKSLSQIRFQYIIDNNINELTEYINKKIVNKLKIFKKTK